MPAYTDQWTSEDNGQPYTAISYTSPSDGNPAGGSVGGLGLQISWQAGPLQEWKANGAFVEDVLTAVLKRLEFYQQASEGRFACTENEQAIQHINEALDVLRTRTARRRSQGVEGTHTPHVSE